MLCVLFSAIILFASCRPQPVPFYFHTVSPEYRPSFIHSYRPYWPPYYPTGPILLARPQPPSVAYAFNVINTRNTCLTNDVCPNAKEEQTTAPTTASCPAPTPPPSSLLMELFNPYIWKILEKISESDGKITVTETTTSAVDQETTEPLPQLSSASTDGSGAESGVEDAGTATGPGDTSAPGLPEPEDASATDLPTGPAEAAEVTQTNPISTDPEQTAPSADKGVTTQIPLEPVDENLV